MGGTAKSNAMRSAVVVVGTLAFGYLTLQLGFKPYLEKAELERQHRGEQSPAISQSQDILDDTFPTDGSALSSGLPESDHKL